MNSEMNSEDEASEANMIEEEIHDKSLISFRLSGPMEELSRNNQLIDKLGGNEGLVVQSPWMKLKRWLMRKKKGKKKISEYSTNEGAMSEGRPQEPRSYSTKRALKSANEKLRQSTRPKNPVIRYKLCVHG